VTEINSLADILEQCINSSGGSASDTTDGMTNGTNCGKLFYLAPNSAGTTYPTDTVTAAMDIAQSPARNTAKLNDLRSTSPVFQPALSVNSPPSAWTIAITYNGGGLSSPQALAVDASGNVWTANSGNSSVTKLDNTGAAVSGTSGYTAGAISTPLGIAIDQSGNPWVANSGNNSVTKLATNGATGTAYASNGLSTPKGIAIDSAGNVWVTNTGTGSGLSAFTSAGAVLSGSPYSGGGLTTPPSIAASPK
jgi:secreted PhoX family phosphatase